jgi:hypothetical protein
MQHGMTTYSCSHKPGYPRMLRVGALHLLDGGALNLKATTYSRRLAHNGTIGTCTAPDAAS